MRESLPPRWLRNRSEVGASSCQPGTRLGLVALDPAARLLPERHQALLAPLAEAGDETQLEVQVRGAQPDQLRDAQAGGVEHLEDGAVAHAQRRAGVRRRQQRLHLGRAQVARQRLERLRRLQVLHRVRVEPALAHCEAVQSPHRVDGARDGARLKAGVAQGRDEARQVGLSKLEQVSAASQGELAQPAQVVRVGQQRVLGEAALHAQVIEVGVLDALRHARYRLSSTPKRTPSLLIRR